MAALKSCSVVKVVSIAGSYADGVLEAALYAVQHTRVERLRLGTRGAELEGHTRELLQQIAAALSDTACSVWDLEIDAYDNCVMEMLSQVLQRKGSTLLKLILPNIWNIWQILVPGLCSPNCRLQHLELGSDSLNGLEWLEHTRITSLRIRSLGFYDSEDARLLLNFFLHTTITCLSLPLTSRFVDDLGPQLFQALQSGKCKLRHVHFEVSPHFQRTIVDWLEANPGINCLELLELRNWESPTLKEYCAKILERNKRYRAGGLLDEDQVDVSSAKLFMCGHTGMGKTTITRNLVRRTPCGLPACLQRHRSTYGIDVHPLTFPKGQQLLVCDIAGQHEYHSFHHYFVRGSDKDIFVIVCRGPPVHGHESFKEELHYWLRFIAAHRGVSSDKLPTVFIVLNYFSDSERKVRPEERCWTLADSYRGVIHFAGFLGLVGTSYRDVKAFKKILATAVDNLLKQHHLKMPKLSQKFLEVKRKIQKTLGAKGYATELVALKKAAALDGIDDTLVQLSLLHLHDMGELLFFEKQGNVSQNIGEQLVILDFQWFVRDVIGIFVPRLSRTSDVKQSPPSSMQVEEAKLKLGKISPDGKHTEYLMDVLQTMGVLIIDEQNVKVLSLLVEDFTAWPQPQDEQTSLRYWGRRFSCRDKEVTLLPSGIFAMLQVRLGDIFGGKVAVGKGWIHSVRDYVNAMVKIGGKTGDWHDRHWINVLLRGQD